MEEKTAEIIKGDHQTFIVNSSPLEELEEELEEPEEELKEIKEVIKKVLPQEFTMQEYKVLYDAVGSIQMAINNPAYKIVIELHNKIAMLAQKLELSQK